MKKQIDPILQRYKRLIEITRDLASSLDLDELLKRILSVAVELSNADVASILLYDENKDQLYFRATTDLHHEVALRGITIPAQSIAGWVIRERKPLIVSDVHKDERHFNRPETTLSYSISSIIALPMITKDKLVGVLEVLNKKGGDFNEDDQQVLLSLSTQAAYAIENARLFQQSDLISDLVHEIRTPLASIGTVAYLLQRPEISDTQRIALGQTIYQEIHRLDELTTNFLDLARLESRRSIFQITHFDFLTLLEECFSILRPKANENSIELLHEIPINFPEIIGDRDKINQVLLNLISNAIKFNRPKGIVKVKAWIETDRLLINVQDNGIGISGEDLPHIFEKFYRAHSVEGTTTGTGLGLSICKMIIEAHNGQISVQSALGYGSTYTISLPLNV